MPRYLMIDRNSGWVWGEAVAAGPVGACRALDESIGIHEHEYRNLGAYAPTGGRPAYHVHMAPENWRLGDAPGDDPVVIDEVERMPRIATVIRSQPNA